MKRLIGGILIAAGILIGGASGLCTAIFGLPVLFNSAADGGMLGMLAFVAALGGIPMLIGFGLYKLGRKLIRDAEADRIAEYD